MKLNGILIAIFYFKEEFQFGDAIAFFLIWVALFIYSFESISKELNKSTFFIDKGGGNKIDSTSDPPVLERGKNISGIQSGTDPPSTNILVEEKFIDNFLTRIFVLNYLLARKYFLIHNANKSIHYSFQLLKL